MNIPVHSSYIRRKDMDSVLNCLVSDAVGPGELAERLQAHQHGAVSLVSRCEKLGLVERRPGRDDRRAVEVHLTAAGEALVARIAARHRDELRSLQELLGGVFGRLH